MHDISDDVITLGRCFSMFVYIRIRFHLALIGGKSGSSVNGELQGNRRWKSNFRDAVASSPSFFCLVARVPQRACSVDS